MDIAYISAFSALGGSVIGGLTSAITAWLSQRDQIKAGQYSHNMSRREDLYRDFVIAASKMHADTLMNKEPQIQEMVALHTMINRMRMLSSARTIAAAEKLARILADSYLVPDKTPRDLREIIKAGGVNPLKDFSEAARKEFHVSSSL